MFSYNQQYFTKVEKGQGKQSSGDSSEYNCKAELEEEEEDITNRVGGLEYNKNNLEAKTPAKKFLSGNINTQQLNVPETNTKVEAP